MRSFSGGRHYDLLSNFDVLNLLLRKEWGETQNASFYFHGLECSGGRMVGGGGVG